MSAVRSFEPAVTADADWIGVEHLQRIATEWKQLCAEGLNDEPFYRPEWIAAFLRCFEPQTRVLLLQGRVNGRLKAVLPLISRVFGGAVRFTRLQGTANVHSCRFDLVRGAGAEGDAAVEAIWSALKALPHWDSIELPRVPSGGAAEYLLTLAERDGFQVGRWAANQTPIIMLGTGVADDPSLLVRDSHFRQNLRRRLRKARSSGPVHLRRAVDFNLGDLETFFDLEKQGWKGQAGSAIACNSTVRSFYIEAAKAAAEGGYLSLYFLELGGECVAAHFGLSYGTRYFCPKVAYDETHSDLGPGHLIINFILADIARRGTSEFDFLGPMMSWKSQWATDVKPHSFCYIFNKTLRGRLLHFGRFSVMARARTFVHLPPVERFYEKINRIRKALRA